MKAIQKRRYTEEFKDAAIRQVLDGKLSVVQAADALEMWDKTLGNWVREARRGVRRVKAGVGKPVTEVEAELSRLRAENARLKMEKEILKKRRRRTWPRCRCEVRLERGTARLVSGECDVWGAWRIA